jgi:hypothetical protein
MTIKQQGGIFGRNPTFNDVTSNDVITENLYVYHPTTNQIAKFESGDATAQIVVSDNVADVRIKNTAGKMLLEADPNEDGAGSYLRFTVDGSTAAEFTASGNLAFPSGQGIDFSATSGTGTSELFSDYEQGSWSPVAARFTGGAISATYNTQAGYYTKVGNLVTCSFYIDISSISQGSSLTYISGLPYAPARSYYDVGTTGNNTAFTTVDVVSMLAHTDSRLYFREAGNTSSNSSAAWAAGALSGTITYMTS